jgi:hypothetical protein
VLLSRKIQLVQHRFPLNALSGGNPRRQVARLLLSLTNSSACRTPAQEMSCCNKTFRHYEFRPQRDAFSEASPPRGGAEGYLDTAMIDARNRSAEAGIP